MREGEYLFFDDAYRFYQYSDRPLDWGAPRTFLPNRTTSKVVRIEWSPFYRHSALHPNSGYPQAPQGFFSIAHNPSLFQGEGSADTTLENPVSSQMSRLSTIHHCSYILCSRISVSTS